MPPSPEVLDRLVTALTARTSAAVDQVWRNPLGGRTYRFSDHGDVRFLKVSPAGGPPSHDLTTEAERLTWIGSRVRVPEVLDSGRNEQGSWLLTRGLPGLPASDSRWRRDPHRTAMLLGVAIREFHDRLAPAVSECPWDRRVADRVLACESSEAARAADSAPPELDLVVAHGDLCAPNILLTDPADETGFVDLGQLGVADRAADLGCHAWSLAYNQLGGVVDEFLDAYGFAGDRDAVRWYRHFYEVA